MVRAVQAPGELTAVPLPLSDTCVLVASHAICWGTHGLRLRKPGQDERPRRPRPREFSSADPPSVPQSSPWVKRNAFNIRLPGFHRIQKKRNLLEAKKCKLRWRAWGAVGSTPFIAKGASFPVGTHRTDGLKTAVSTRCVLSPVFRPENSGRSR